MAAFPRIVLKKGKEKPLLRGHPWVFSGAVARLEGDPQPGDTADLYASNGQFLGRGHVNPNSQILLRILTHEKELLTADFLRERMVKAHLRREPRFIGETNAYRVVNSEGDLLPGLIVDRYGEVLVLQCLTAGMERWKGLLVDLLVQEFKPQSVYERSDTPTRKEEGLPEAMGLHYGRGIPELIEIAESGCRFNVNPKSGQKTGFYLDQRENRLLVQGWAQGRDVLDCCCYTGGFSIHAGRGRATTLTLVDTSKEALARAGEHLSLNGLDPLPHLLIRGDAFEVMRGLESGYDLIILDPPPFAKKKSDLPTASRGYKDLNLQAFRLLRRGGLLFTFSCSHHMGWDLFQKVVFSAAVDSGQGVQLLGRRGQAIDHPIHLCHPEGEYLRGLICRVL